MVDITLHIVAPELTAAINNLADSMKNRPVAAPTAPVIVAPTWADNSTVSAQTPVEAPVMAPVTDTTDGVAVAPTDAPAPVNTTVSDPVPAPTSAPDPVQAPTERVYTMDDIKNAGSQLLAIGKMEQLMELLQKNYNVQAVTQLKPEQYATMVDDLRKLGAKV